MVEIRIVSEVRTTLGEGPLWDVDEQRLYWIDSDEMRLWRCAPDGGDLAGWIMPGKIGSLALRAGGGAVTALDTGLHLFDFQTGQSTLIAHPERGLEHVRLNDGKVDHQGRFVVGSLDMAVFEAAAAGRAPAPRGSIYRLDPDHSLHRLGGGFSVFNGPCFSPDGSTLYFSDTPASRIEACDWDGTVETNRRLLAEVTHPDGCTVDAEGCLWSVGFGTGAVRRIAPDGTLLRSISLPVPEVASCMFGGADLDTLFVTTMAADYTGQEAPLRGCLLAVTGLGVRGLPEPRFAG